MKESKLRIKDFELDEKFKEKYPDFERIYTRGKNLILEHFKNGLIVSRYYDDDIVRTLKALEQTFESDGRVEIDFVHSGAKQFLKDFGQLLGRRLLQDAKEEEQEDADRERQEREDQQHKHDIIKEVKTLKLLHPDITVELWQITLKLKHDNLRNTVQELMPDIWLGLDFALSVLRVLNLYDCTQPFIGLLLGRPGSGKTVILSLLRDWPYAYFKDRFTPKAFLTHTTAVNSRHELEEIDMLPKMKDNIFLTPELAPIFSKKEDELVEIIGIIIRLADGQGLSDHSGAHGGRAYRDTMFTWAGAAVDIPNKVYKILSTLGPKWYHFRLPFKEKTEEDLMREAKETKDFSLKERAIKEALFDYLKWFEIAPHAISEKPDPESDNDDTTLTKAKIEWDKARDEDRANRYIVKVAMLLTHLRCAVHTWQSYADGEEMNYESSVCEDPSRTRQILYNLARGHALTRGRNFITIEDVSIVVKTVLSTAHIDRVAVFSLLISMPKGKLTTDEIMKFLNKSKYYALKTMTEFKAIGLADMDDVDIQVKVKKQSLAEYTVTK
jgi:hypothetical protein